MPHGYEYPALKEYLYSLSDTGIDGVIAADLGVIALVREILPEVGIHVSTQASIVSAEAAEQYCRLGCCRAVLARELTLDEIRRIRKETTRELELEAFIHGSMCVSWERQVPAFEPFYRTRCKPRCLHPALPLELSRL